MTNEEAVREALSDVYDPELYVDLVTLGLIYGIEIKDDDVHIEMTLTSPGCPYGPQLIDDVKESVGELDTVRNVSVNVTFDPVWTPDRISDDVRAALGF
jgi:metal-sulfur cluster biosynthetic enzyme